nr:NADH dehydrogenase subunit 1 [Microrhagus sp. ZM-2022]
MIFSDVFLVVMLIFMLIVGVLVSVAFLTLLERKILGYIQFRKGPNKVGMGGIVQPFGDAIKLFLKELTYPLMSNLLSYIYSPVFAFFLSLLLWLCTPFLTSLVCFNFGFMFFLCCSSLGVYTIMVAGWSSNSMYSLIGGLRSVAQSISYEVSLALIFISFLIMMSSFNLVDFMYYQQYVWLCWLSLPLSIMFFISMLAETNRTPFDFAEGESELVSGFNVEYSSGGFSLIFLAEYSSILFMSFLFVLFFMGEFNDMFFYLKFFFIVFMFLWVRGTLPRFRYDKLMYLAWKSFLVCALNYLFFFYSVSIFVFTLLI